MVKRPGPETLTMIDFPVETFVKRSTSLPLISTTTSPFGSGGNVFANSLFTRSSTPTAKLHARPAGISNGSPERIGDRIGLPLSDIRGGFASPTGAVDAVSEHAPN